MANNTITLNSQRTMTKQELCDHLREFHAIIFTRFSSITEMQNAHWMSHNNAECAE